MVYSQYIHIKGCGSSSVKAYNTNFNMSLISTIYNKIYTWMQVMIKKCYLIWSHEYFHCYRPSFAISFLPDAIKFDRLIAALQNWA